MKQLVLSISFLILIIFPSYAFADGPYLNIPPTNAFDKIHSDNGTVDAVNYSMPLTIKGDNGVSINSNNKTHTIIIKGFGNCSTTTVSDQTSNKTFDVIYQNTSDKPILVIVNVLLHIGDSGVIDSNVYPEFRIDSVSPPTTFSGQIGNEIFPTIPSTQYTTNIPTSFMVPPNWYYELTSGNPTGSLASSTIQNWLEYANPSCGTSTNSISGSYNQTLANNIPINTNGFKINYINGTGNPIHVVNSNAGQQVNVTISSSGSFSTRTIDLSTAGVYTTTIDNDTADTAITATSKPASPQFVQTISAGNIPTDITDVQDYTVILTVGGKNTNATTAKTISMIPTRNGVEVDTTRSVAVTSGNFWESGYYLSGSALTAGDKIGLKMWCSSSPCSSGGGLDYRYGTVYVVPRQFISTSNSIYMDSPAGPNLLTLSGAVTGVTYSTSTPAFGTNPVGNIVDPILGSITSNQITFQLELVTIKGQSLSIVGSGQSPTQSKASTDIGITPAQQAASNLMSMSFPKFIRINTIS